MLERLKGLKMWHYALGIFGVLALTGAIMDYYGIDPKEEAVATSEATTEESVIPESPDEVLVIENEPQEETLEEEMKRRHFVIKDGERLPAPMQFPAQHYCDTLRDIYIKSYADVGDKDAVIAAIGELENLTNEQMQEMCYFFEWMQKD